MTVAAQEWVALSIVVLALASASRGIFRAYGAAPLSRWLLKRGRVGLAMKVRAQEDAGDGACGGGCATPGGKAGCRTAG